MKSLELRHETEMKKRSQRQHIAATRQQTNDGGNVKINATLFVLALGDIAAEPWKCSVCGGKKEHACDVFPFLYFLL